MKQYKKAFVVGLSGASGSGKSTLSAELARLLPGSIYISVDKHYKKELPTMVSPVDGRTYPDWNHPDAVERGALLRELEEAAAKCDYVLVDGAFLFCLPEIVPLLDYKIYVEATIETRLFRRISRNLTERGQTLEFIGSYYLNCARVREKQYALPSKYQADLILDNENGFRGMEREAARIIQRLRAEKGEAAP